MEIERERIRQLEEQMHGQQQELEELRQLCGPVLTRLSLNCEQILELIQSELITDRQQRLS